MLILQNWKIFLFSLLIVLDSYSWIKLEESGGSLHKKIDDIEIRVFLVPKKKYFGDIRIDYNSFQIDFFNAGAGESLYTTSHCEASYFDLESPHLREGWISNNLLYFIIQVVGGSFLVCRVPFHSDEKDERSPRLLYHSRMHWRSKLVSIECIDHDSVVVVNQDNIPLFRCNSATGESELLVPKDKSTCKEDWCCCCSLM